MMFIGDPVQGCEIYTAWTSILDNVWSFKLNQNELKKRQEYRNNSACNWKCAWEQKAHFSFSLLASPLDPKLIYEDMCKF